LQENELREKDLKIQESLIRFSKYIQDNDATNIPEKGGKCTFPTFSTERPECKAESKGY